MQYQREFANWPAQVVEKHSDIDYETWIASHELVAPVVERGPLISVVMPTYETPETFLQEVIASVRAQRYLNWELCICDDASTLPHVRADLDFAAANDARIRITSTPEQSGIAAATNGALALARGEYIAFIDHDDLLHPDALGSLAAAFGRGQFDVVYTDHDCINEHGHRSNPYFKPDWSPDLFTAQMYIGHLLAVRKDLVEELGGLRSDTDGSQDYDLVLRCIAHGANVGHVPRVLYHWRQHAGSTAANANSKPYAHHAGRRAIQNYLERVCPGARVEDGGQTFCYDVRYPLDETAHRVSIIIPTRDGYDLLRTCIDSLCEYTAYRNFELLVVDNGSRDPQMLKWLERKQSEGVLRVLPADIPFNWSVLNNLAARQSKGDVLVFLNNDVEIIDERWLGRLVENALRKEVGVCGPLLLYGDGTIQHAGVVVGMGGWADHIYKGAKALHMQCYAVSPVLRRNVLAVTGACMAITRERFEQLGGFDESFIVCGSDVDFCLRAYREGLLNVYVPEARLIHHESKTRDPRKIDENDFARSAAAYAPYRTEGDPYFHPALDPMSTTPRLRERT
jgi:GT2 family glycosyltransferase